MKINIIRSLFNRDNYKLQDSIKEDKKKRKIERANDDNRYTGNKENYADVYKSRYIGQRRVEVILEKDSNTDEIYTTFENTYKNIKKLRGRLGKLGKLEKANMISILNDVMKELNNLDKLQNVRIIMDNNVLKYLHTNQKSVNKEHLLKGIDQALDKIKFCMSSVQKRTQQGIVSKAIDTVSAKFINSTLVGDQKIPRDFLLDNLFNAIDEGDVKYVSDTLKRRGKEFIECAAILSDRALKSQNQASVYVIQLLVNKNLFSLDATKTNLQEFIDSARQNGDVRMAKLLTKIAKGEALKKLYVDVPDIKDYSKINSAENIKQLENYIKENKSSQIKEMIKSGHVDLRNLNNKHLINILGHTAKKIKPATMRFLLNNGFDINVTNNEKILLDQAIRAKNLAMVKYLLQQTQKSSKPTLEQHKYRNKLVQRAGVLADNKGKNKYKLTNEAKRIYSILKKEFQQSCKVYELYTKITSLKFGTNSEIKDNLPSAKTLDLGVEDPGVQIEILAAALDRPNASNICQYLKGMKINFNAIHDADKSNILMVVASLRNTEAVKLLLTDEHLKELIDVESKDQNGSTPLHHAIFGNNPNFDIVKLLLDNGASVDTKDEDGENALEIAKNELKEIYNDPKNENKISNLKRIINLLQGIEEEPIGIAREAKNKQVIASLEAKKNKEASLQEYPEDKSLGIKEIFNKDSVGGEIPDFVANEPFLPMRELSSATVQDSAYTEKSKDIEQSDAEKYQELRKELQEYLKDESKEIKELFNADKVNLRDQSPDIQNRVLSTAVKNFDSANILEYLNTTGINFTVVSERQANILMDAVSLGKTAMVEWILNNAPKEELIKQKDNEGSTPLHYAISFNNSSIVNLLLDAGASLYITDKDGDNALNSAIYFDYLDMVELLLKKGANFNATDQYGNTALHHAIYFDNPNPDIVKLLLENGADFTIENEYGDTALELAKRKNNKQIIKLLEGAYKKV